MRAGATKGEEDNIIKRIREYNLDADIYPSHGKERRVIGIIGNTRSLRDVPFEIMPGVETVKTVTPPYEKVLLSFTKGKRTIVPIRDDLKVGGKKIILMAGPCAVETKNQLLKTAKSVKEAGAHILRGGAFKPRTSPYSFQGLGKEGLEIISEVKEETGLPVVTEVKSDNMIDLVSQCADILQIGARNMQNFDLLEAVGKCNKPILLKRGMQNTIEEWLLSAEYILQKGNWNVILCERGIRTFENSVGIRNTLDLSAVAFLKQITHLPVIVDPSHATGKRNLVMPMSRAAIAAGADGLLVEVHWNPEEARSDGAQSLLPEDFNQLVREIREIAKAVGREV